MACPVHHSFCLWCSVDPLLFHASLWLLVPANLSLLLVVLASNYSLPLLLPTIPWYCLLRRKIIVPNVAWFFVLVVNTNHRPPPHRANDIYRYAEESSAAAPLSLPSDVSASCKWLSAAPKPSNVRSFECVVISGHGQTTILSSMVWWWW